MAKPSLDTNTSLNTNTSVKLLYHIVASVLHRFGEQGREVVKDAVYKFGHSLGKEIKEKVEALGLEVNLENFLKHNGIYSEDSFNVERKGDGGLITYELRHWPLEDQTVDQRKISLGLILCELDRALLEGYNEKLAIDHISCLKLGSRTCQFVSKVSRI